MKIKIIPDTTYLIPDPNFCLVKGCGTEHSELCTPHAPLIPYTPRLVRPKKELIFQSGDLQQENPEK